jgi:hypothetical protein
MRNRFGFFFEEEVGNNPETTVSINRFLVFLDDNPSVYLMVKAFTESILAFEDT